MRIFAIGDIQGCQQQLDKLLTLVNFDPASDYLWLAGDVVNRGPESLATLAYVYSLRDRVQLVLGNHDLHLLAIYKTNRQATSKDTLAEVLDSPDADKLLGWLLQQPLLHEADDYILCHAGIYPDWSLNDACSYAREVEAVLVSDQAEAYFAAMYGNEPDQWQAELSGMERLRFITNAFTRMRYCHSDGRLDMVCKKPPAEAPADLMPWYERLPETHRKWQNKTLLIGHWASLMNLQPRRDLYCLDSGCVWGRALTAFELTERRWFQTPGLASPTYT